MIEIQSYKGFFESGLTAVKESFDKVAETVNAIINDVKSNGDSALYRYAKKFDGANLNSLKVEEREIENAYSDTDKEFIEILKEAAENIRLYHEKQVETGYEIKKEGIVIGRRVAPMERCGLYVPGGTASYPSTVLMAAIPAKIAGVKEIIIATPPLKDGSVSKGILAAAKIAGVTAVYKVGGAQAIAALCYGTETVPRVDIIAGPGNIYVAAAKKAVFGDVAIDMIAGPSEILIIADNTANPDFIAADMLSQAEHDKNSRAILICTDRTVAENTRTQLYARLNLLERRDIARESIEKNAKIIIANSLEEAVEISDKVAPEHLELCVARPFELMDRVKNAGSIFLGNYTPEPIGDYFAGTNHTLPTGGSARFSSPLSVDSFVKKSSYIYYEKDALAECADKVAEFSRREGLTAHGEAILARTADKNE